MSKALEGLGSLPWGLHALVAVGMAAGIVLWLCGRRVLRPLMVALAVLFGAAAGGLVVPSTSWGASLSIWHGMGLGALMGLMVGLLLYRSAMAMASGVVLGAALPLIAATALRFYPIAAGTESHAARVIEPILDRPHMREPARGHSDGLLGMASGLMDESGPGSALPAMVHRIALARLGGLEPEADVEPSAPTVPDNLRPAADRVSDAWRTLSGRVRDEWNDMPSAHRAVVGLAGVIGLAGGVVAGLLMPMWAAGTVTALFGSAVWLPCFVWLSNAMNAPWRSFLDRSAGAWLVVWAVVAFAGMTVQWRGARRARRNAPPAPAAA